MKTIQKPLHDARTSSQTLRDWLYFLFPLGTVLVGGLVYFREAVIRSILSTQHPELVYAILAAFFVGVVLSGIALLRYTREHQQLHAWAQASDAERNQMLERSVASSYLRPLYALLHGQRQVSDLTRQSVLEQEISNIQTRIEERLTLPHYLAGALVGLGLVGTFVGLLGTLEDLGGIFGSLANTGNASTGNPADLFVDMVRRLQDPMRGMGTAFVASLYGLLGSLVLGLQILLVGKVGQNLIEQMHALVRQFGHVPGDEVPLAQASTGMSPAGQGVSAPQLAGLMEALQSLQVLQTGQAQQWQAMAELLREQQQNQARAHEALRREVQAVTGATQALIEAVRQNTSADERYRASVPRTTYWQDAWVKVQAYLQRSNTDQTLAQLSESNRAQVHALVELGNTLVSIEQRLRTHLGPQQPENRSH